jgi:hypothetical protein
MEFVDCPSLRVLVSRITHVSDQPIGGDIQKD